MILPVVVYFLAMPGRVSCFLILHETIPVRCWHACGDVWRSGGSGWM